MKKEKTVETRGRKPIGKVRNVKVSDADWEGWRLAAQAEGITLAEWIREACDNRLHNRE